jgi:acetyltransferase-like isoleucine patch superfamily enzyme
LKEIISGIHNNYNIHQKMLFMPLLTDLRIGIYFILTVLTLIISFFPIGYVFYFIVTEAELIYYLLGPLFVFLGYCITTLFFGIVHSQIVVRLTLPYTIKAGTYPHFSSEGRLVGVRISADGIFKSMLNVFTFLPFIWGMFLFPYLMRLYGLKCGKNVHIATRTYIETAGLVSIGDNSFIGYNSAVSGHAHENRAIVVAPVKIGKNCLVGTYSIVGPASTLEDGSVLGANSAILKGTMIPSNQIWGGSPAKNIGDRIKKKK